MFSTSLDSSQTRSNPTEPASAEPASSRWKRGLGWGIGATVAMSVVMIVGMTTGIAPMPEPIPAAIVTSVLGSELAPPLLMGLAGGSHLGYGGLWGLVFAESVSDATIGKGLLLGVFLWLLMQVAVLPMIGWGLFGTAVTPAIAGATLVLHLIYGAVLGWGLAR